MKNLSNAVFGTTLAILILSSAGLAQGSSDEVYGMSDKALLPPGNNAWVVHLFTLGGRDGRGLPPVTAVSDGSFACGEILPSKFQRLSNAHLKTISDAVLPAVLKPDKTMKLSDPPFPPVCNDCYFSYFVMTRRDTDNKVRTYSESTKLLRYPPIANTFAKLKETMKKLDLCPK
jgi:hypothetical protein